MCKKNEETVGSTDNMNSFNRHIAHLGRSDGFVEGCGVVYMVGKALRDY
jgi:hypothetical protein